MIPRRHRAPPRAAAARRAGSRATTPSLRRRVRRVRFRLAPSRSPPTRDGRFRRYSRRPPSRKSREFARLRDARTTRRRGAVAARLGFGAFRSTVGETLSARSIAEPSDGSTKRSGDARASPRAASNKTVVAAPFCLVSERPTTRRRDGGSFGVTAEPVSKTGSARAPKVSRRRVCRVCRLSLSARRERMWFYVASARGAPPSPDFAPPPAARLPASPRAWASAPWPVPWRPRRSARGP